MKFSIIIPVYNTGELVKDLVSDLMTLNNKQYEVICINDGSTDNSYEKLIELQNEFNDLKVFTKENGGLSHTRNFGIHISQGEYIIFLDSDDTIELVEFEKLLELCHSNIDIVHGNFNYTFENNQNKILNKPQIEMEGTGQEVFNKALLQDKMSMIAWANIYRKEFLIKNNLFFKEGIYHEDEEFNLRAFAFAKHVKSTNIYFYNYLQRSNSITNSNLTLEKRFKDILDIYEGISSFLVRESYVGREYKNTCLTYISMMVIFGYIRFKDRELKKKYFKKIKSLNLGHQMNSKLMIYRVSKHALNVCPQLFLTLFSLLINYRNKRLKM